MNFLSQKVLEVTFPISLDLPPCARWGLTVFVVLPWERRRDEAFQIPEWDFSRSPRTVIRSQGWWRRGELRRASERGRQKPLARARAAAGCLQPPGTPGTGCLFSRLVLPWKARIHYSGLSLTFTVKEKAIPVGCGKKKKLADSVHLLFIVLLCKSLQFFRISSVLTTYKIWWIIVDEKPLSFQSCLWIHLPRLF